MEKIEIRGIYFDNVDMSEALLRCKEWLTRPFSEAPAVIHTPNAEIVQQCIEEPETKTLINSADLIIPDGSGIILASKILGTPLKKGKVAGVELSEAVVAMCRDLGLGVYILGGKPGVPETASDKLREKYPGLIVSGVRDGYFKDGSAVAAEINRSGASFLIVCLGVPKQEKWIFDHRHELGVKLTGGFGGSVDIFAGTAKRAPKIFIRLGLEWFYRLLCEPKRIVRMMKIPKFIFGAFAVRPKHGSAKRH